MRITRLKLKVKNINQLKNLTKLINESHTYTKDQIIIKINIEAKKTIKQKKQKDK